MCGKSVPRPACPRRRNCTEITATLQRGTPSIAQMCRRFCKTSQQRPVGADLGPPCPRITVCYAAGPMPTLRVIEPSAPDYRTQIDALLSLLRGGGLVASSEQPGL